MSQPLGLDGSLTNYGDRDFARYLRRSFARSMGISNELLNKPVVGLKVAKPEISAKDGSPRKRVRPLSVYSEDPELAFVHAAQTHVGANPPLPNGFLLGR
jgi:hypothetical protein